MLPQEGLREFVEKEERAAKKHLAIIKGILEQAGMQVVDRTDKRHDPYLFVFSGQKRASFEGVRIYEIGGEVAFRIQKTVDTHPFGKAYQLPIEEMFDDMLGEGDLADEEIAQEIAEAIVEELQEFFKKSAEAEHKQPVWNDPLGKVTMRSTGTDYANSVTGSENR